MNTLLHTYICKYACTFMWHIICVCIESQSNLQLRMDILKMICKQILSFINMCVWLYIFTSEHVHILEWMYTQTNIHIHTCTHNYEQYVTQSTSKDIFWNEPKAISSNAKLYNQKTIYISQCHDVIVLFKIQ